MNEKKIILVHPAKQHSYRTAEALIMSNNLFKYCTTVYYNKSSTLCKIAEHILNKKKLSKLYSKHLEILDDKVLQFNELLGWIYLLGMNYDNKKYFTPYIYKRLLHKFGRNVANYAINENVDVVISYDITSTELFFQLKKRSKKTICVLDLTSIPAKEIYDILEREYKFHLSQKNSLSENYRIKMIDYSKSMCKYFQKEITLTDYFLVASSHVKKILIQEGIKKENVFIIPYGADTAKFSYISRVEKTKNRKINFLFVGRVEGAKGIFYMLEALKRLYSERNDFRLTLVGSLCRNEDYLRQYSSFCKCLGKVDASEMPDLYKDADVFILPSLWEGLSLSLLEAMASGLPAIATDMTGGEDIIKDYENGFLIKTASIDQIYDKAKWMLDNKNMIEKMGINAAQTAKKFTWNIYYDNLNQAISKILQNT